MAWDQDRDGLGPDGLGPDGLGTRWARTRWLLGPDGLGTSRTRWVRNQMGLDQMVRTRLVPGPDG